MALSTRAWVSDPILPVWLIVRETVEMFTFARRATSIKLAGFFMKGRMAPRRATAATGELADYPVRKQGTNWVDRTRALRKRLHAFLPPPPAGQPPFAHEASSFACRPFCAGIVGYVWVPDARFSGPGWGRPR